MGRAGPHAGRILAVVAQDQKRAVVNLFRLVCVGIVREGIVIMGFPDPLDFMVFVFEVRHVVNGVAHLDEGFDIFGVLQFAGVDHHGPVFCEERFGTFANAGLRPVMRPRPLPGLPVGSPVPQRRCPPSSRSVFGSYPLFFSFGVIDVAIPAVGIEPKRSCDSGRKTQPCWNGSPNRYWTDSC
jgi:hypothetical protein